VVGILFLFLLFHAAGAMAAAWLGRIFLAFLHNAFLCIHLAPLSLLFLGHAKVRVYGSLLSFSFASSLVGGVISRLADAPAYCLFKREAFAIALGGTKDDVT